MLGLGCKRPSRTESSADSRMLPHIQSCQSCAAPEAVSFCFCVDVIAQVPDNVHMSNLFRSNTTVQTFLLTVVQTTMTRVYSALQAAAPSV